MDEFSKIDKPEAESAKGSRRRSMFLSIITLILLIYLLANSVLTKAVFSMGFDLLGAVKERPMRDLAFNYLVSDGMEALNLAKVFIQINRGHRASIVADYGLLLMHNQQSHPVYKQLMEIRDEYKQ